MFYLHGSNKTENLLQHLAALIRAAPPESLFDKEYILIQSKGMERMISQAMAKSFTSWCNYQFLLPLTFLEDIGEKLGLHITPDSFERSILCWRIEEKLRDIDEPVYSPLRNYLSGKQVELKRFQLARQIANIFDQYQLMRPQMLQAWQEGKAVTKESAEGWQMHLWKRLIADDIGGKSRGELLQEVISALHQPGDIPGLPHRVSVFGVHILPPLFLDYLHGLANHTDVHLFLLSPCKNYWGDIGRRPSGEEKNGVAPIHHPLLSSLGQQGRVFQEMLLEKIQFAGEYISYDEPLDHHKPGLLQRLQADLLAGQLPENGENPKEDDSSIRIVSCHTRERELSVLHDHIVDLLEKNPELQLDDIVVMAPDIQVYGPLIGASFEDIQHSIADRSISRSNLYISTFQQFLDLFKGRFGWSEVFHLLQKELVYRTFQLSLPDLDRLQQWSMAAGIRWGLSAGSRARKGFEFNEGSWQKGLERLLMGVAIDSEEPIDSILPYSDLEGRETLALGGLCEFISIIESAENGFTGERSLQEWSAMLLNYARLLFSDHDSREFLELVTLLNSLADEGSFHQGEVSFEVITQWFGYGSNQAKSVSGFLKCSLTFCSMLPMRSIPFRAICLIGLDYGVFPQNDRQATYDLMKKKILPGDRSLRADDRYQFLEVLLSARDWLYLSYIGQSVHNNTRVPPSVVVTELLETLAEGYGVNDLVEHHPLHGFSHRYFSSQSSFFSYSENDCRVAAALNAPRQESGPWWQGRLEPEIEEINLLDLFSFYRNPQQFFLQQCLGMSLQDDEVASEDTEMFRLQGLDGYSAQQIILDNILKEGDPAKLQYRLLESGCWPLGTPGELLYDSQLQELEPFGQYLLGLDAGEPLHEIQIDLMVGSYRLSGTLANRFGNTILLSRYAKLRAKDLLVGWLHHLLGIASGDGPQRTLVVMKDQRADYIVGKTTGPGLEELVDLYVRGRSSPVKLLLEPGLEFCRQQDKAKDTLSSLDKARKLYERHVVEGYEPSWQLLFENTDTETVVGEEFVKFSEEFIMPLWRSCHEL